MKPHPIADIFPLMSEPELKDLAEDIKANGLREPITIFEGKILDGRNRFRACEMVGVKPRMEEFRNGSPTAFVISLNLQRRHLTDSQKVAVAVEALPLFEREAKERQKKHGHTAPGKGKTLPAQIQEVSGEATEEAARFLGVSGRYVAEGKAILKAAPAEFEAIKNGSKTVSQVRRELMQASVAKRVSELPSDKFRVFYADPPWNYGSTFKTSKNLSALAAENNYPTMTIAELCALRVEGMADENAVLFLWVTSPLLAEVWPVIKAWGFEYKACFVWDKGGGMPGNYSYVRHEFLLLNTRGSCVPEIQERPSSIQGAKRGRHSEKPEHFRELIDRLYPSGKRIELFARAKTKGWEAWGNEA